MAGPPGEKRRNWWLGEEEISMHGDNSHAAVSEDPLLLSGENPRFNLGNYGMEHGARGSTHAHAQESWALPVIRFYTPIFPGPHVPPYAQPHYLTPLIFAYVGKVLALASLEFGADIYNNQTTITSVPLSRVQSFMLVSETRKRSRITKG
ncbi:hypothetical protein BGX38DRAFT_1143218 [Terfezia claveryi]|nr:hypothetical protein BGX38DRAFT_1143218 [Terfezia claveryi]